ncbi:MAG: type II secretion system F family protein [Oscillospiraceae bacterium]
MANYSYVAVNAKGKEIKGAVEAESQSKAAEDLKKNGLVIASLQETGALGKDISLGFLEKKPKPRDMAVFCRQFVSIINAGVSVVAALNMLGDQTENRRLRTAITDCRVAIEKGESLAGSMAKHRDIFSDIFITMAEAGEASGSLDVSFGRMADQFEKSAKLKATVKKASIYPIVVVIVAIGVIIGMLTFVIPTFQSMFDSIGGELPGITKMVIAASAFVQHYWWLLAIIIAGLAVGIAAFKRTDPGKHFFGKIAMKLPLIGKLTVKTACARMARTLSTLMAAGIPLIDAIQITSETMSNIYFRDALQDAKDDVAMGSPLSSSIKNSKLFPPLVYHMMGIGEETGDSEGMLERMAAYYEDEVEQTTAQVMAALEPMIIVILAMIVGVIIMAVMLPMVNMYSALDSM